MKAVITAEFTHSQEHRLHSLGITTVRTGWGATGEPIDELQFIEAARDATFLITEHDPVTRNLIEACQQLRLIISCRGTPVSIDLEAAERHDITVLNTPGRNADAVADFTIGCIINAVRHISASAWQHPHQRRPRCHC